ncbi:MAG TPA: ribonuclease III [Bacteroides sp.]|nr:ribonuclease III [Bacteroides sp.]HER09196.1 ribonuclease III [Bacteroides sp.]
MKDHHFLFPLIRMLGFLPLRLSHYRMAVIPKSAGLPLDKDACLHNERLEYLGDAVIDAIVADFLFRKFPGKDEGFMTKLRARIVKRKNLDWLAEKMDIPGMIPHTDPARNQAKHLYGNVLEALMGAIYLDRGYRTARRFFIRKVIQKHVDLLQLVEKDPDYKSRMIEWAQKYRMEVVFESKEEHSSHATFPSFVASVLLNGKQQGTGKGGSKKEAEQRAAKKALAAVHTAPSEDLR